MPAFVISLLGIFMRTNYTKLIFWNVTSFVFSCYLRYIYGPGDLSNIKIRGQYKVGHINFHVEDKYNAVSVFYPMSKDRKIEDSNKK